MGMDNQRQILALSLLAQCQLVDAILVINPLQPEIIPNKPKITQIYQERVVIISR
jgi:hypothetical protein